MTSYLTQLGSMPLLKIVKDLSNSNKDEEKFHSKIDHNHRIRSNNKPEKFLDSGYEYPISYYNLSFTVQLVYFLMTVLSMYIIFKHCSLKNGSFRFPCDWLSAFLFLPWYLITNIRKVLFQEKVIKSKPNEGRTLERVRRVPYAVPSAPPSIPGRLTPRGSSGSSGFFPTRY